MNKELVRKVAKLIYDERPGQIKYTLSPRELALGIIPIIQKAERQWIPVNDRLPSGQWNVNHPELSEEVLIANSCSINIGFYNRDNGTWYVDVPAKEEWIDKITHWMLLPKNPHEGEDNE